MKRIDYSDVAHIPMGPPVKVPNGPPKYDAHEGVYGGPVTAYTGDMTIAEYEANKK